MLKLAVIRASKLLLIAVLSGTLMNWTILTNIAFEQRQRRNDGESRAYKNGYENDRTAESKDYTVSAIDIPDQSRDVDTVLNRHEPTRNKSNLRRLRLMEDYSDTVYTSPYEEIPKECHLKEYKVTQMPAVSVVITYHDSEHVVDILRTVESVVRRTPDTLLREIVLVDDNCTTEELLYILERMVLVDTRYRKVQLLRNPGEQGLIQARSFGIEASKGEVVVCMDSHVEVQARWLEPLLESIVENKMTLASSYLDWMDFKAGDHKWHYTVGGSSWKTYFDWELKFGFQEISRFDHMRRSDPTQPIESPVIVGTVWAMSKSSYLAVGGLDTRLKGWGGENIDLPLKVWLSGGRTVNVPCSHVAHLEDPHIRRYRFSRVWRKTIDENYKLIAEKWFDEYKRYFYFYKPSIRPPENRTQENMTTYQTTSKVPGKLMYSFDWFLKTVYPELGMYDVDALAYGWLKNTKYNMCLYVNVPSQPALSLCEKSNTRNQVLSWTKRGELRLQMHVLNAHRESDEVSLVSEEYTSAFKDNTSCIWSHSKGSLLQVQLHSIKRSGPLITVCLTSNTAYSVTFTKCNASDPSQQWTFDTYSIMYNDINNSLTLPNYR